MKCLLEEYGFNSHLCSTQSERVIKILEVHDMKYKEIIPGKRRLSLVQHERYIRYRKFRQCLSIYTSIQLGALPNKTSLESITENHYIGEPKHEP